MARNEKKSNFNYAILNALKNPHEQISKFSDQKLNALALEIRNRVSEVVRENGGHLGPNLGAVEITIACHAVFDLKKDRIFFDVGHQSYPHKIITKRHKKFFTLRKEKGISGYPHQKESIYDTMRGGHASTAISTALGAKKGFSLTRKNDKRTIALVGDGSMTGGMAFEGLNHAGHLEEDLIVILNDNSFSISPTVGGLANALNNFRHGKMYQNLKNNLLDKVKKIPRFGRKIEHLITAVLNEAKKLSTPSQVFTVLGFDYLGPIDGNDVIEMKKILNQAKEQRGPTLIHAITEKGVGYNPHGLETTNKETNLIGPHALSPGQREKEEKIKQKINITKGKSYSAVFTESLISLARQNSKIVAITAAMAEGTGLVEYAKVFPKRYFDVGICEAHATGFCAGLNLAGQQPAFVVYSTFLQRAFDQIFHEIVLQQNLAVVFAIDRAGLVGDDGPSHHGIYDIAYLRIFPNFVLMAPKDQRELTAMLQLAFSLKKPVALRYPRDVIPPDDHFKANQKLILGEGELLQAEGKICCLAYGSMVYEASLALNQLKKEDDLDVALYNLRFAKPISTKSILNLFQRYERLIVLEEGVSIGGVGSAILEVVNQAGLPSHKVHCWGIPDKLIEHAPRKNQLKEAGLSQEEIVKKIKSLLKN